MSRVFGYARTADHERTPSLEEQRRLAEWKAADIDGIWKGCRAEHGADSWTDRPGFEALLGELEPGDHLVVHDLRCLDSRQEKAIEALQTLLDRQVRVYVLDMNELGLDLDPAVGGRSFLELWRRMLAYFDEAHRNSIRDALQYRKRMGLVYNAHPPFGKKRVVCNGRKMDMWDRRQCSLIVEIWERHHSGESIYSIARDFNRRRERTGSGQMWAKRYGKGRRRVNANRLYRAHKWYTERLTSGHNLCDVPVPKGLIEWGEVEITQSPAIDREDALDGSGVA